MNDNDEAKLMTILCMGLEPAEQKKVERLDGPISQLFIGASLVARICQGVGLGSERVLNFSGPTGIVGSTRATTFVAASDSDAINSIVLSCT